MSKGRFQLTLEAADVTLRKHTLEAAVAESHEHINSLRAQVASAAADSLKVNVAHSLCFVTIRSLKLCCRGGVL